MTSEPNQGIHLSELLYIFRRHVGLIAAVTTLGFGISIFIGLRQPTLYTATALIMVEPSEKRILNVESVLDEPRTDPVMLQTHVKVLESRDQGLQVVNALALTSDPEFQPRPDSPSIVVGALRQAVSMIAQYLPEDVLVAAGIAQEALAPVTPGVVLEDVPFRSELRASAAPNDASAPVDASAYAFAVYKKRLSVAESGKSYILAISFTSNDPDKAARIANTSASLYLSSQVNEKVKAIAGANEWLANRLEVMRSEYLLAQSKTQAFRAENNIVTIIGDDLKDKQLTQLNSEIVVVRSEKSSKLAKLKSIKSLKDKGLQLDAVAEVVDSPLIMRLREDQINLTTREAEFRENYGGRHPKIIELEAQMRSLATKVEVEIDRIIVGLQNDVDVISARELNVQQEIERVQASKNALSQQIIKLGEYERQAEAARQLYDAFLHRFEETKQQGDLVEAEGRVVSRAAPPSAPDGVSPAFFALLGFVGSSLGAGMLAIFVDRQRATIRRGTELKRYAGLSCVATVPLLPGRAMREGIVAYLVGRPRSALAEALHSITAGVHLGTAGGEARTIGVTSALPGEGKSFCAVGLAVNFARLGYRTLLVDCDLRRPAIARTLALKPGKGVDEFVIGNGALADLVVSDEHSGIDVLTVARVPQDPIRLLTSIEFETCVTDLSNSYERVIIDCPPTLGMNDTRLIGRRLDAVVFVVSWDRTPISAVKAASNELREAGINLVGGLINMVDLARFEAHGYGTDEAQGYYSKYKKYYRTIHTDGSMGYQPLATLSETALKITAACKKGLAFVE